MLHRHMFSADGGAITLRTIVIIIVSIFIVMILVVFFLCFLRKQKQKQIKNRPQGKYSMFIHFLSGTCDKNKYLDVSLIDKSTICVC